MHHPAFCTMTIRNRFQLGNNLIYISLHKFHAGVFPWSMNTIDQRREMSKILYNIRVYVLMRHRHHEGVHGTVVSRWTAGKQVERLILNEGKDS